jgi:glycosyltransferase involved in cell wall biosynthesis
MAMGAFPIQSNTACTGEWITEGVSGFAVPPEDPQIVADAIRIALKNDALVDEAARINQQVVTERLDRRKIKVQVIQMYKDIYNETRSV